MSVPIICCRSAGLPEGEADDGLFAMHIDDYRTKFTRLDAAKCFLPKGGRVEEVVHTALQLTGLLTERYGGAQQWWKNPRIAVRLKECTQLTLCLNQPNTKVSIALINQTPR